MYLDYIKTPNYYQTLLEFTVDVVSVVDCG